jgi:hypothetical protein
MEEDKEMKELTESKKGAKGLRKNVSRSISTFFLTVSS